MHHDKLTATVWGVSAPAGTAGDDQTWSWSLPFVPASARVARAHVTVLLRRCSVPQQIVEDAQVVVSELVGNALRHARALPSGTIDVGLEIAHDSVRIFVVDGGSATLPTLLSPPPLSLGGRGLSIVRTLTRQWGVHETRDGNTVFGVLDRA